MTTTNKTSFDFASFAKVDFSAGTGAKERVWAKVEAAMNDCYEIDDADLEMLAAAGDPFTATDYPTDE